MPIISFCTPKGGAGKTTSAIVLATTLARGVKVEIIDADPARRAETWSKKKKVDNLSVVASKGERFIQDEIDAAASRSAFVIVDLEGAATQLNAMVLAESNLVIIPTGDEQQDADAAVEALAQIKMQSRTLRRTIPSAILFARTKAAVKARNEREINAAMRGAVDTFKTELNSRTAFSSLHSYGGSLYNLDRTSVSGVEKAIENAESWASEVIIKLKEHGDE